MRRKKTFYVRETSIRKTTTENQTHDSITALESIPFFAAFLMNTYESFLSLQQKQDDEGSGKEIEKRREGYRH